MQDNLKLIREQFLAKLLELLLIIEQGMLVLEEPIPRDAEENIVKAIASFGDEALPKLHDILESQPYSNIGYKNTVDAISMIGDPRSCQYLINYREMSANYMTSLAVLGALRKIGTEISYIYLASIIVDYANGNERVIASAADLHVACWAMKEWGDSRAIDILEKATTIENFPRMPEIALEALAQYPSAYDFLNKFAMERPDFKQLIDRLLQDGTE